MVRDAKSLGVKKKSLFLYLFLLGFSCDVFAGRIELPQVSARIKSWNCGPISAYRMMLHVQEQNQTRPIEFKSFQNSCPLSINVSISQLVSELAEVSSVASLAGYFFSGKINQAPPIKVGPAPAVLADHMNRFSAKTQTVFATLQAGALSDLTALVDQGKPAIALIKVGEESHAGWGYVSFFFRNNVRLLNNLSIAKSRSLNFTPEDIPSELVTPLLHYVVINGYDDEEQIITYIDTDNTEQSETYEEFLQMWDFALPEGFLGKSLQADGVFGRMMIYAI